MQLTISFNKEHEIVDKLKEISRKSYAIFVLTLSFALKTTIITLTLSLKKIALKEIQISH